MEESEIRALHGFLDSGKWRAHPKGIFSGDGWGVYYIESEANPEDLHHIDLASLPDETGRLLNGHCSCEDFTYRCYPNWKLFKQVKPYALDDPHRTQCKHIERAKTELLREILWKGLKQERNRQNEHNSIHRNRSRTDEKRSRNHSNRERRS